jgi:hypothetical protein
MNHLPPEPPTITRVPLGLRALRSSRKVRFPAMSTIRS